MANCCYQYIKVVSENRKEIKEFKKMASREHPLYALPLFDADIDEDICEEDGYYTVDIRGWTKWSLSPLLDCDETDENGVRYVGIPYLLTNVLKHTAVELQCEETSKCYSAWMNVAKGGSYRIESRPYYDWLIEDEDDMNNLFKMTSKDGILTEENEKDIREAFADGKMFTVLIGGFEWDYSSARTIMDGEAIAPVRRTVELL